MSIQRRQVDESTPVLHYSTPHRSAPSIELVLRARLTNAQYPKALLGGEERVSVLGGKEVRYE